MARYVWGVDSATNVTNELYESVMKHFGYPSFWGRYLTTTASASDGLTKEEIRFIRDKGMKIIPIYNVSQAAIGYREGRVAANNAIYHARRLGFPQGTAIFATLEQPMEIDGEWIQGWVEAITPSGYKSGLFKTPGKGNFNKAFSRAVQENEQVKTEMILWSTEPEVGVSKPGNAPRFNPKKPSSAGDVWLWQYGKEVRRCPIDMNLADSRLLASLW